MFWERFFALCSEKNTFPNPVGKILGISSGTVTGWKNGSLPHAEALQKIADYFDVSTDYLLGRTDVKKYDSPHTELSPHEANIINAYRAQPEIQHAIDRFLGIKKEVGCEIAADMMDVIETFEKEYAKKPTNSK